MQNVVCKIAAMYYRTHCVEVMTWCKSVCGFEQSPTPVIVYWAWSKFEAAMNEIIIMETDFVNLGSVIGHNFLDRLVLNQSDSNVPKGNVT